MRKILIVDDASFMRKMIRDALEPLGYQIAGDAENGLEGVEQFERLQPDLTTMDITMPVMNGIDSLRRIKGLSPTAKVIMITAVDQREPMRAAMALGVTDFIVKPFDEERIVSAVEKAFSAI